MNTDDARKYALSKIAEGESHSLINELMGKGFDRAMSQSIYNETVKIHREREERIDSGRTYMKIGGSLAILGALLTTGTYLLADEGSMYVIFWGAIAVGVIQFLVGVSKISD